LLQHATGDDRSEHRAEVEHNREALMSLDSSSGRNDSLPSMSPAIEQLIDKINADKKPTCGWHSWLRGFRVSRPIIITVVASATCSFSTNQGTSKP
jgi:hypothetical protein